MGRGTQTKTHVIGNCGHPTIKDPQKVVVMLSLSPGFAFHVFLNNVIVIAVGSCCSPPLLLLYPGAGNSRNPVGLPTHTLAVCAYPGHSNMPYEICSDRRHCQIKRKFFQKTWKITKINEKKNVNRNVKFES